MGEGRGVQGGGEGGRHIKMLLFLLLSNLQKTTTKMICKYREHLHGTSIRDPVELCFVL